MNKSLLCLVASCSVTPLLSHASSPYFSFKDGDGFKRFSVSVGALYVKPTGKAQPFQINTVVAEGEKAGVGDVKVDSVLDAIDESKTGATAKKKFLKTAVDLDALGLLSYKDENGALVNSELKSAKYLRQTIDLDKLFIRSDSYSPSRYSKRWLARSHFIIP